MLFSYLKIFTGAKVGENIDFEMENSIYLLFFPSFFFPLLSFV